jgi:hypothetical protein
MDTGVLYEHIQLAFLLLSAMQAPRGADVRAASETLYWAVDFHVKNTFSFHFQFLRNLFASL